MPFSLDALQLPAFFIFSLVAFWLWWQNTAAATIAAAIHRCRAMPWSLIFIYTCVCVGEYRCIRIHIHTHTQIRRKCRLAIWYCLCLLDYIDVMEEDSGFTLLDAAALPPCRLFLLRVVRRPASVRVCIMRQTIRRFPFSPARLLPPYIPANVRRTDLIMWWSQPSSFFVCYLFLFIYGSGRGNIVTPFFFKDSHQVPSRQMVWQSFETRALFQCRPFFIFLQLFSPPFSFSILSFTYWLTIVNHKRC